MLAELPVFVKSIPTLPQSGAVDVNPIDGLSFIVIVCTEVSEQVPSVIIWLMNFVPKVEYVNVYQLDVALINALNEYIELDLSENETTDSIIAKLKVVDEEREKEIDDLKKDRDFFYKRAKKSFFGAGFAAALTYDPVSNDVRFRVQAGVFYVFKIELKLFK